MWKYILVLFFFISVDKSYQNCFSEKYNFLHCGNCGHCSNENDLTIYKKYNQVLTRDATHCSFFAFINNFLVQKCFENYIGFTKPCSICWTKNVICDYKKCMNICLNTIIKNKKNNNENGSLNTCLQCDETNCGPEFINCAGATRRRAGIVTDIHRYSQEMCNITDHNSDNHYHNI